MSEKRHKLRHLEKVRWEPADRLRAVRAEGGGLRVHLTRVEGLPLHAPATALHQPRGLHLQAKGEEPLCCSPRTSAPAGGRHTAETQQPLQAPAEAQPEGQAGSRQAAVMGFRTVQC